MRLSTAETLRAGGIKPSAQRVAVAEYVLHTDEHPSADQAWARVRERFPMVSRATVYNTLNLLVARGLVRQLVLTEGHVVFDSRVEEHHHFIDEDTGAIHDLSWEDLHVSGLDNFPDLDISEYQVVLRGHRKAAR